MWKLCLLLVIAIFLHNSVNGGRIDRKQQKKLTEDTSNQLQSAFSEIKFFLHTFKNSSIEKFNLQTDDLFELVEALREMHAATVPLIEILIGGDECGAQLSRIQVNDADVEELNQKFESHFQNVQLDPVNQEDSQRISGTLDTVEALAETCNALLVGALDRTKDTFTDIFDTYVKTQDMDEILAEQEAEKKSKEVVDTYIAMAHVKITEAEQEIKLKIKQRKNGISLSNNTANALTVNLTNFDNTRTNIIYHTFDCEVVEVNNEQHTSSRYLSIDDVNIMHKSLQTLTKDLIKYANDTIGLGKSVERRQVLEKLIKRAQHVIKKIQKYYQLQESMEQEVFKKFRTAIKKEHPKIEDLDTRFITKTEEVRELAKAMYLKSNDIEKTLNKIKIIEDVPTAVAGIEGVMNAKADQLSAAHQRVTSVRELLDNTVYDLIKNRFQTSFEYNTGLFGIKPSRFIYDLYMVRDRTYAMEIVNNLQNNIDSGAFLMDPSHYMADTVLLLDLNLQLILRSHCSLDIHRDAKNADRKYTKLQSYIDLVKVKYSGNDSIVARFGILEDLLHYYRRFDLDISKVAACKTLDTMQGTVI